VSEYLHRRPDALPISGGKAQKRSYWAKEDYMLTLLMTLADGVTVKIGSNVWSFSLNFILYLVIAGIVGLVAEALVRYHLPFGFIGAIIAALIGIWLMTNVIVITGLGDLYVFGVPLIRALIGALILVGIWSLITYPFARRRYTTAV
jgi:uncharacterized membrane protein YeaQ/YmgE (transglycosylase-associated protein family)